MTVPSSVCALVAALAIVLLGLVASRHVRGNDHFVAGCDSFGYERMARVIRQARAAGTSPNYFIEDAQTRFLIDQFKASGLPAERWSEIVTTHAHHYFLGLDRVGPQYPPGTSWMMSLFPESNDIRALDQCTIWFVVAGGCTFLAWAAWQGLTLASFVVAGAVAALLSPFGWVQGESYSVGATLAPLCVGTVLAWMATRIDDRRWAAGFGLGAGLCLGLLVTIRLASALLVPAAALLFVPWRWWLALPYGVGVVLTGVWPVLLHNQRITGRLLGATYNGSDTAQTFDALADNFRFYFGRFPYESGLLHAAGLLVVVLFWLALVAATRPPGATLRWRRWVVDHAGLVAAPVCALGLTLAYFLTHQVTIYYYLTAASLLTCLLLALLGVTLEEHWRKQAGYFVEATRPPAIASGVALTVALLTLATGHRFIIHQVRNAWEAYEQPLEPLDPPAALLDPHAWIWADFLSSSIAYYTGHPAFKLPFSDPELRRLMYGWVHAKGDPQYLVVDSELMKPYVDEARAAGWQLTPIGALRSAVCYRMDRP